jgi:tRNA threonylcarbamoyladenosine biosynthesis protein TsaE
MEINMTIISTSEKQTEEAGFRLAQRLCAGDVVALYGGLGAGKTAFVRGMTRGLGINTEAFSPTFTIVNEYPGKIPLFHFDMYRLSGPEELFDIGWEDYLERGGICAVEWSENVEKAFEGNTIKVFINRMDETSRMITIEDKK